MQKKACIAYLTCMLYTTIACLYKSKSTYRKWCSVTRIIDENEIANGSLAVKISTRISLSCLDEANPRLYIHLGTKSIISNMSEQTSNIMVQITIVVKMQNTKEVRIIMLPARPIR